MTAHSVGLTAFLSLRYSAGGHPVTRAMSQRAGAVLAWLSFRLGLSPNAVTLVAAMTSLLAAWSYAALDSVTGVLLAVVLTQLGYAFDCADGQLARATSRTSRLGGWLDVYCDILSITALGIAVVAYPLLHNHELTLQLCLGTGAYLFARVSDLLTCTVVRTWANGTVEDSSGRNVARLIFLVSIDTPVVLLLVCALREFPSFQPSYLYAVALLFVVHGVYVGWNGAARARPAGG